MHAREQAELIRLEADVIASNVLDHFTSISNQDYTIGRRGYGSTASAIIEDCRKLRRDALVLISMFGGE